MQLAPLSTTSDLRTALACSISKKDNSSRQSLLFKIVVDNGLQRGADLEWLSMFPAESEVLYPPLTYLQPTGRACLVEVDEYTLTVVEAKPVMV